MIVLAIDPGYRESATVAWDGTRILAHHKLPNETVLKNLATTAADMLVLEQMQMYVGHHVGAEVFMSEFWAGRFAQAWHPRPFEQIARAKVRGHHGAAKGGDTAVRLALITRFGPYKETAIGTKQSPGPLYGVKSDCWSALAIAVAWHDLHIAAQGVL